jgi:DNA gyrase/topoisomerase IV subunit B
MQENKITKLSDVEHILLRPNMYMGGIRPIDVYGYLYNTITAKFEYSKYSYIPGLYKVVCEILDNSVDEYIRTNGKFSTKIDVNITDGIIKIMDTGRGVPTGNSEGLNISQLELAFTHAKAGSNFNDDGRETIGANGVGSMITNVFSQWFKVTSQTSTQLGTLFCENNLSKHTCKIINHPAVRTGTTVEFLPDYKRFGIEKIDGLHTNLIYQRLIHLAVSFPDIQFTFNGELLKFKKTEKYLDAFADSYCYFEDPNNKFVIAVTPNATDDFKQCSYVNGLGMTGGNHIDVINNEIISRLREHKVFKKYPITPGDIRNKIQLIVIMRKFPAMEFDSQSKERLTNAHSVIKQYFNTIDWDDLVKNIAKNEAIVDPILMTYKLKEELKNRLALKNMEKIDNREVRCEKYYPSISEKTWMLITEGDSACSSLISALGRNGLGYFASRGIPLNAYTANITKFTANKELTNLVKILGMTLKKEANQYLTYKNVVIATDADADGAKITSLYLGFFQRYAPVLFKEKRIKKLRTPIITFNNNKNEVVKFFFKLPEYNEYIEKNGIPKGCSVKYYKGLGSWTKEKLQKLVKEYKLEYFIEDVEHDETTDKLIDDWIGDTFENCESRKVALREFQVNIEMA